MNTPARTRHLFVEGPDNVAEIDFLDFCTVRLELEDGTLRVHVMGKDDRASILLDELIELPEADLDDDEDEPEPDNYRYQDLSRADCVRLLESVSIQCYDTDTTAELREAVQVNVADETIDRAELP